MGVTTVLRGLRVPVAALDGFLKANGLMPTFGDPLIYSPPELDPASKLIRTKLGDDNVDSRTRLLIPSRRGQSSSDVAYIAYDWIAVLAQRQLNLAEELLDWPPPGFAELRDEIMRFADDGGFGSGQYKVEDLSGLFVIIDDYACFSLTEPYLRKVRNLPRRFRGI
jgi:hypothetical protein